MDFFKPDKPVCKSCHTNVEELELAEWQTLPAWKVGLYLSHLIQEITSYWSTKKCGTEDDFKGAYT